MPSTASSGGLSAAGRTPRTARRRESCTWTAGSNWRPSPNTSERRRAPLRETCTPSSQSTRSGCWRWANTCSPPSALRQKPEQRKQPLCTRSSAPSAAPSSDLWGTPQGPNPARVKTGNTPPGKRQATPSGPPRPTITEHACRARCDWPPAGERHNTSGYLHLPPPLSRGDQPEDPPRTREALRPI